ncbi:MAG: HD domain-containing protein [Clostridiales bacterium]|nr:HD domain-containing protein [Clostridiales bacterium]
MRTILVTAFEPFGGKELNTSAEVLRRLPDTIGEYGVRKKLLPVVFGRAAEIAAGETADAVFLLGEAGGRDMVTPETRAVNRREARIPDNDGNRPAGGEIIPGGPKAYYTRIPVRRIAERMRGEGYAVAASEDAGTYVCNDTFYLTGTGRPEPVAFIHCPAEGEKAPAYAETIRRFIEIAMAEEKTVRDAQAYIRELFRGNADGHGTDHTMRVFRNALLIADTEPDADRLIVSLGALLHDADDPKIFRTENNANARRFLEGEDILPETAEEICRIINGVSFSKNGDRRPGITEGKIVQDADRLDALGAIGIARTFAYGGKHGRAPEDSIAHFHEKLLRLKNLMNTAKGREMAESRHAFLETFLKEWDREQDPGK